MTIFVFKLQDEAVASFSGQMTSCPTMARGSVEDPWDDNLRDKFESALLTDIG